MSSVLMSTLARVPKYTIAKHVGVVMCSSMNTRNIIKDAQQQLYRATLGGRYEYYEEMNDVALVYGQRKLAKLAHECGANAVVNVRVLERTTESIDTTKFILTGDAVIVEKN